MSRFGGPLTADKALHALAAMGTPVTMLDEPSADDLPVLIGCLLASVDAALHDLATDEDQVNRVVDGYARQLGNAPEAVVRLLHDRLTVLAFQLRDLPVPPTQDIGAVAVAAQGAFAVGGLLGVQIISQPDSTGQRATPAMLGDMLRRTKKFVGSMRRGFDQLVLTMRGRGVQM